MEGASSTEGVSLEGGAVSGDSSELSTGEAFSSTLSESSPPHEAPPPQHSLPRASTQHPQQVQNGPGQAHSQSQSPTAAHSRNPSVSQPVQPISDASPEERPLQASSLAHTPPFFDPSASNMLAHVPSSLSPVPTPVNGMNGFMASTPMSGYDDFVRTVRDHSDKETSPHFMLDPWNTMPMGNDFDPMRIDPALMLHMNMDMSMGPPPPEGLLGMIPDMSSAQNFGSVQTPIQTPHIDESFSDLQIGSSASMFYPSNRHSSIADAGLDLGAIIAAQDGWTVFRCTPSISSSSCPRTARMNLERLELSLRNHEGWSNWSPSWDESDFQQGGQIAVSKLGEATRDKLLAITQSFLHKALDIHKDGTNSASSGESPGSIASGTNFVLLPPGRVLEYFLRSYANSFERYYPTSARGVLDVNELMRNYNDKASSLLILMMIAQGAMNIPSVEARWLTGGFTEACRISLFDLIEKNIIMAGDPIVLRAALLFTVQAAWSGDKWQMDIAMGQRGMYFAMLRHSGILDTRPSASAPHLNGNTTVDMLWQDWMQQEGRSRLIYSWVMVDQDLSLFHDTAPLFSVTECAAPMPDADLLWQAQTALQWSETFNRVHAFSNGLPSVGSGARPLSLRDLFRSFLDDEIVNPDVPEIHLTPMHMRLLLHPLQALVCQYSQLLSCFSDSSITSRSRNRALTAASTRVRLEEVQALLGRWSDLAKRYLKQNPICPMMQANLVMFHLISMNAITNFPEIERLARREGFNGSYEHLMHMHKKCLSDVEEAIMHAGQIMRLIREMPRGIRPPWWPGAVYRAGLVIWIDSLRVRESVSPRQQGGHYHPQGATLALDRLPSSHPLVLRFVSRKEGIPSLTKLDGTPVLLDNGFVVLSHCIDVLDEGVATRFSDGIRNKLEKLARA
ncbi:hypothetical protein ACEQ8H_007732 [Pleosporales sp. CAS-2024a]